MGAVVTKRRSLQVQQGRASPEHEVETRSLPPSRNTSTSSVSTQPVCNDVNGTCASRAGQSAPPVPSAASHSRSPEPTVDIDGPPLTISSSSRETNEVVRFTRGHLVEKCLDSIESGFGMNFERAKLLENVQEVHCDPNEILLRAQRDAVGVYIVEEGGLEVISPGVNATVLRSLQAGDFCGELSSFFHMPCTATVRSQSGSSTTALLLSQMVLSQASHEEEIPMYRLLKWCTERSYVGTAAMFEKLDPSLLVNAQIVNCLKSPKSVFSTWSNEAQNCIAAKSSPILFSSGDVLYKAEEEPAFCFLILHGSVVLSNGFGTSYDIVIVRSSSQGCCIGRESLTGSRMAQTATATSPLLTVPITLDLLTDTVNQFPNNAAKWRAIRDGNTIAS